MNNINAAITAWQNKDKVEMTRILNLGKEKEFTPEIPFEPEVITKTPIEERIIPQYEPFEPEVIKLSE